MDRSNATPRCPAPGRARPWISLPALALTFVSAMLAAGGAAAQPRAPDGAFFDRLDANGDGIADGEELQAARRSAFQRADKDGDGYITADELRGVAGDRAGMHRRRRGGFADRADGGGRPDGEDLLRRLDENGDGRVSEGEFVAARNPLLERFDANADGAITRSEAEQAQSRMRGQIRRRRGI